MHQRLKSWESPRRQGRNDKGKGGAARQRQLKKQTQRLRQKLKDQKLKDQVRSPDPQGSQQHQKLNHQQNQKRHDQGKEIQSFPLFF